MINLFWDLALCENLFSLPTKLKFAWILNSILEVLVLQNFFWKLLYCIQACSVFLEKSKPLLIFVPFKYDLSPHIWQLLRFFLCPPILKFCDDVSCCVSIFNLLCWVLSGSSQSRNSCSSIVGIFLIYFADLHPSVFSILVSCNFYYLGGIPPGLVFFLSAFVQVWFALL